MDILLIRRELKAKIIVNPKIVLKQIKNLLNHKSNLINEILVLEHRFNKLNKEKVKEIISVSERKIEENKLIDSLINIIDRIEIDELTKTITDNDNNFVLINYVLENIQLKARITEIENVNFKLETKIEYLSEKLDKLEATKNQEEKLNTLSTKILSFRVKYTDIIKYYPHIQKIFERVIKNYYTDEDKEGLLKKLIENESKFLILQDIKENIDKVDKGISGFNSYSIDKDWYYLHTELKKFVHRTDMSQFYLSNFEDEKIDSELMVDKFLDIYPRIFDELYQ